MQVLFVNVPVQGRPLLWLAASCDDNCLQAFRTHFLTMHCTSRAADALVHQGTTEVVDASVETHPHALLAEFCPGSLDVGYEFVKHQAGHGVHQHHFAKSGSSARVALAIDRRLHMHEWQWHEFRKATGFQLQFTQTQQMAAPVYWLVNVPEHDGRRRR